MIKPIYVRAVLRLVALGLVAWGILDEEAATVIYTDPDLVGIASLAAAEIYFYINKALERT